MFKNIFFDHAFNEDPGHKLFKRLGKLGFILSDMKVEHPGKAHCRFIELAGNTNRKKAYLEFVSVGKGGISFNKAGLSFGYKENLESFYKKLSKVIPSTFFHKNYQWKENSQDRLPGWNMISLQKSPIRSIYTWFTEYEKLPGRKKKDTPLPKHPNSIYAIYGFELTLSENGRNYLEKILGRKLKSKTLLADGTYLFVQSGRVNRFNNIILKCKSLQKANKFIKNKELTDFDGLDALVIKNNCENQRMWSLMVVKA